MDKKTIVPRKQTILKGKGNFAGTGFIALGARSTTPDSSTGALKREGSHSSLLNPLKRPRFGAGPSDFKPTLPHQLVKKEAELWQTLAIDAPVFEILDQIEQAESKDKTKKIEQIICGIIAKLNENKIKMPDPLICSILSYFAKEKPIYLQFDSVLEGFFSLLKKPSQAKMQNLRTHPILCTLVSNLIVSSFEDRQVCPDCFIKAYLDDALSDRAWVDRKECSKLINMIEQAFDTKKPSPESLSSLYFSESSKPFLTIESLTAPISQGGAQSPFDDRESGGSSSRDATIDDPALTIALGDQPASSSAAPVTSEEVLVSTNQIPTTTVSVSADDAMLGLELTTAPSSTPVNRCKFDVEWVKDFTVELLRDLWSKRPDTISKSLLKTMASCCGYAEVRLAASQKLDNWIQNPKLQRPCVDLMLFMCVNCKNLSSLSEQEIIQNFLKLRLLKSKPVTTSFCIALKELLNQNDQYLKFVLRSVVCNEFSPSTNNIRSPNNMLIFSQCFQYRQLLSTKYLAEIFVEFLLDKDEHLRNLRLLLREIVKTALKYDFPFVAFCETLCNNNAQKAIELSQQTKEKLYHCIEDLLTVSILLGISPTVKDASISLSRSERRDLMVLKNYHQHLAQAQLKIIDWLQNIVPQLFRPLKEDYVKTFGRILFLEKSEYYSKDNMPELEKNLFLKIIGESSLSEEILLKICIIGLSPNLLLNSSQAIDLIDQLIKKAAMAAVDGKTYNENAINITKLELIELLWSSCAYRISDLSVFPAGYNPPTFAITFSYWRVMMILLILACYNPATIGRLIWDNYPTLRIVMQIIMAEDYNFPPATASAIGLTGDEIKRKDLQTLELERQEILELENYLAAASTKVAINESNSHLLSQIMRLDPKGPIRRPPPFVLEQLKTLNQQLHLGLFLCKSRDPDFLLEIISKQGASHSLPWLVQLIQKNEGSLSVLPVQCLCEFLLCHLESLHNADDPDDYFDNNEEVAVLSSLFNDQRVGELRYRLRNVLWSLTGDLNHFSETLTYFINRLQADSRRARLIATKALNLLTSKSEEKYENLASNKNHGFWLSNLIYLPHYSAVKLRVASTLLKCCLIETEASLVCSYVEFLNKEFSFSKEDPSSAIDSILDESIKIFSKIICQRRTFFEHFVQPDDANKRSEEQNKALNFLLELFNYYLNEVRKPQVQDFSWSANQEQLLIQWGDLSAVLNVEIVSASLLLLSVDKPKNSAVYDKLLDLWIPRTPVKPCAFLVDTTEEAELIPDWVKIRLLRSKCDHVVDSVLSTMDDGQIIVCLQTFGLPISNVSKLLTLLDKIVLDENRRSILVNMGDERLKTLSGFVKSYRLLKAKGGESFLEFLENRQDFIKSEPGEEIASPMEIDKIDPTVDQISKLDHLEIDQLMNKLFLNADKNTAIDQKLFSELSIRIVSAENASILKILDNLRRNFKQDSSRFIRFFNKYSFNFSILLRNFDRFLQEKDKKHFFDFCDQLLKCGENIILRKQLAKLVNKPDNVDNVEKKVKDFDDKKSNLTSGPIEPNKKPVESPNIDIVVHRLLNDLLKLAANSYSDSKMENINFTLRRLATEHPVLFLRQLHLIAALLRGNMSHTMKIYYTTNYLLFFTMVLGLLELLRPKLFDRANLSSLEDIINSFFEFIENHALRNPRLVGIVDKVLIILNDYHTADPERANKYLESCNNLIQALTLRYPEIPSLKSLINRCSYTIPLIVNPPAASVSSSTESETATEQLKPFPHRPPSPVQVSQISPLISRLSRADSAEETVQILKDLADISTKKPDALPYFRAQLEQLIVHNNKECSRLAFELILKHFSHNPMEVSSFLPTLLSCFDVGREDTAKIAINFVPEFCRLYSGKNAGLLLEKAYTWCVKNSGRENTQLLCEAVNAIHHNTLDFDK